MKRAAPVLAILALAACNKSESASTQAAASQSAAPAPPPAFTGALTGERVMGAKDLVHPFQPWPDALAKLEAQMGKPTVTKDDHKYMWGVSQGDDCWYMQVERESNNEVGMVANPMKVSKGGPIINYDECLTAAGVRKEAAEDPNAPGPPPDDKPIGVVALHDGAIKARSKWQGAKVTVQGLYMSTSTFESNGQPAATVSITAAKADLKNATSCELTDPSTAPKKLLQYAPITVSGNVEVRDMLTGGGDRVVDVGLTHCAIVKASAGK